MNLSSIKNEIDLLRSELNQSNYNYYVLSSPTISDIEFDQKLKRLQLLEEQYPEFFDKNSPTQRVGNDHIDNFVQVHHNYPMLSLGNTYNESDIKDFYNRVSSALHSKFEIVCELKFDGVSVSLTYENGELVQACTRGDGEYGDDISKNVRTIRSIPLKLTGDYPPNFEMRGEIVMPWVEFNRLNEEKTNQGENLFANPRNATSGTIKLLNSKEVSRRKLDSYLYYILGKI